MLTEIKNTVGRLTIASLLIIASLIIYSVFILRGRGEYSSYGGFDPLEGIVKSVRPYINGVPTGSEEASTDLVYSLNKIPEGRVERKITNHSWRPFLVTMHEFKGWKYTLPDEFLLNYATRYMIRNPRTELEVDSGIGFDCGTGLGMTLIRPGETFLDTVEFEKLMPWGSLRYQLTFQESGRAFDRLTGAFIGDPLEKRDQYDEASLLTMVPDDELEVCLFLPVTDYFSGEPARVYANEFTVGRWELLEKEIARRVKIKAKFID